MSLTDFCRCAPSEFNAICQAHTQAEQIRQRQAWERMRTHATITIQPHVRDRLTPTSLITFPWEEQDHHTPTPSLTHKQLLQRAQQVKKARGLS